MQEWKGTNHSCDSALTYIIHQGAQPSTRGPHAAQEGHECGPMQNHKCT